MYVLNLTEKGQKLITGSDGGNHQGLQLYRADAANRLGSHFHRGAQLVYTLDNPAFLRLRTLPGHRPHVIEDAVFHNGIDLRILFGHGQGNLRMNHAVTAFDRLFVVFPVLQLKVVKQCPARRAADIQLQGAAD